MRTRICRSRIGRKQNGVPGVAWVCMVNVDVRASEFEDDDYLQEGSEERYI